MGSILWDFVPTHTDRQHSAHGYAVDPFGEVRNKKRLSSANEALA
jgi:hypothetical protein